MSKSKLLINEVKGLTIENLFEKIAQFKKELFNLRFQKTLGELKNTSRFNLVKKSIARLQTELNFRKSEKN